MEQVSWHYEEPSINTLDINDRQTVVRFLINQMSNKTVSMFEWKNLPKTITSQQMELLLQRNGYVGIVEKDGKLYATWGNYGGVRDFNYRPTRYIVSNPYLFNGSKTFRIFYNDNGYVNEAMDNMPASGDCVIISNDATFMGLNPIHKYYSNQIVENLITKRLVVILSRATNIYVTNDEDDKKDFDDFVKELINGEFGAVFSNDIMAKVKTLPLSERGHQAITDLIEEMQYVKASWYNDVGLQANYNMKRESINSNESQLNKDAILPLPDTMLESRLLGVERVNKLFGTKISVDFSSAWKKSRQALEESLDDIDNIENANQLAGGNNNE